MRPIHYIAIGIATGTLLLASMGVFSEPVLAHGVRIRPHITTIHHTKSTPVRTASLTSPMSVEGTPTITVAFIEKVLTYYGSPAQGTGQALYDLGKQYDINPAFALAFFQHESSFGEKGVATATLSLGNLRCIPDEASCLNNMGTTCQTGQSCYAAFATWADGYQAYYQLLRNLYINTWGLRTVEQIIPRYAPNADDNDETAYINSVETTVRLWSTNQIS